MIQTSPSKSNRLLFIFRIALYFGAYWLVYRILAIFFLRFVLTKFQRLNSFVIRKQRLYLSGIWDYAQLREILKEETLPCLLVNLDALDQNIRRIVEVANRYHKTIRIATKSLRIPQLIQHILRVGGNVFKGVMCFSVHEAHFLNKSFGIDDILLGYPVVQFQELELAWTMATKGVKITLMIDTVSHVRLLDDFVESQLQTLNQQDSSTMKDITNVKLRVCIDVDVSYRPFKGLIHIGVHRSPVRNLNDFVNVIQAIESSKHLKFVGVMAYEAHIAGVPDANPHKPLSSLLIRCFKKLAVPEVRRQRQMIFEMLKSKNKTIELFNGGGSGSLVEAATEPWLTEVTVGSSFLQGQLFDYYVNNRNEAAICYALRVTRVPQSDTCVCQSGGFIASGAISEDKQPKVFLPKGLKVYPHEGFGEVQTPLQIESPIRVFIGDPILCRPAKSGEIAEHFNECLLLQNNKIVTRTKTYRGLGYAFY